MNTAPAATRHPDCIYPLCGCAGTANCKSDPLNTPLPCDVKVGHTTFRKGVALRSLVLHANRLREEVHQRWDAAAERAQVTDIPYGPDVPTAPYWTAAGDAERCQSCFGSLHPCRSPGKDCSHRKRACGVDASEDCCHQTMLLGTRCEGCPLAKPGDKLLPRSAARLTPAVVADRVRRALAHDSGVNAPDGGQKNG